MTYANDSYIFLINGCTTTTPIAFFQWLYRLITDSFFYFEADIVAQDARQVLDLGTRLETFVHYLPNFLPCIHFFLMFKFFY